MRLVGFNVLKLLRFSILCLIIFKIIVFNSIVVDLTECITSSDIEVIRVVFAVSFIFHWSFIMKGYVFKVYVWPYWVLLIHDFNFFVI